MSGRTFEVDEVTVGHGQSPLGRSFHHVNELLQDILLQADCRTTLEIEAPQGTGWEV